MRAMLLDAPGPVTSEMPRLRAGDVPVPEPGPDDLIVRVSVCGVCRTDLDLAEGRLSAPRYPLIPGHQVVGRISARGAAVTQPREGDRVGIAWIHSACGRCRWCLRGQENLCPEFRATGCDEAGGYAEYARVPATFAHPVPASLADAAAAPLLCAGAIGWRALALTGLRDGEPLGLSGFGASAHLVIQMARVRFPASPVFVFARAREQREFAATLGAAWTGDFGDAPPQPLAAIIDTTPAWEPVVRSLSHLAPGGRLVINAIRKMDADKRALLALDYARHLWRERELKSVANVTRADVRACLAAAAASPIAARVEELPLAEANTALARLAAGGGEGAMVLRI